MHVNQHLTGLVVCGGRSTRMGQDKSLLNYHQQPQAYHIHSLLKSCCSEVFISCNEDQARRIDPQYNLIVDEEKYAEKGPIAAILSAFSTFPEKSFLVVGCDYPFIELKHLEQLIAAQNQEGATAFYNEQAMVYEPLLACYTPSCIVPLNAQFKNENYSLQYLLKTIQATKCLPQFPVTIQSVDTVGEYKIALKLLEFMAAKAG